jgi:hypothetical protein
VQDRGPESEGRAALVVDGLFKNAASGRAGMGFTLSTPLAITDELSWKAVPAGAARSGWSSVATHRASSGLGLLLEIHETTSRNILGAIPRPFRRLPQVQG